MRPWSTARRRVSGGAHAFVEVTSRRLEVDLGPSQQCVSEYETSFQMLDMSHSDGRLARVRHAPDHWMRPELIAARERRQHLNSYGRREQPFEIFFMSRQSINEQRTCLDHLVEVRIRPLITSQLECFGNGSGLDFLFGDARCGPGPSPVMKGNRHDCVSLKHAFQAISQGGLKASTGNPRGEETDMATLLLLTNDMRSSAEILPALELLPHQVKVAQAEATALLDAPAADVILLDARRDLVGARSLCRLIETTGKEAPLLVIAHEGGLAALSADWGFDDLLLATAGPAEVDVRLRLAMTPTVATNVDPVIQSGNIMIDEAGYSAKLNGVQLDLTYTEFELLKYLAQHPGRVFSRQQLLSDVWGYDYYGGTRTVDVHVRRLRAKLGPEYESVIGTVRNVGYRFVTPAEESARLTG